MATTTQVTVREAVDRLVSGLRRFAVLEDRMPYIGHASESIQVRTTAARQYQQQAGALADALAGATEEEALLLLGRHVGDLNNMDPRGTLLGPWAHVARMVHAGANYTISDGVLYQCR